MAWKFVEGLTVADVAFQADAPTLEGLLSECGEALTATMVKDVSSVKPAKMKKFVVEGKDEENLLFEFLQKLVFYKDAEVLLFGKYELKLEEGKAGNGKSEKLKLSVKAWGERINPAKHELLVDVKAVTWHKFAVERRAGKWKAQVILDI